MRYTVGKKERIFLNKIVNETGIPFPKLAKNIIKDFFSLPSEKNILQIAKRFKVTKGEKHE